MTTLRVFGSCAVLALFAIITSSAQTSDVVLYPSDVTVISGNWARIASTTGAAGLKMTSQDRSWSTAAPLVAPTDFFEAEFDAQAGITYRLWLRMRAAADSKWNESVWVQFSGAVDQGGSPLWRIGSDAALLVNLEDCGGCGVAGWGWQDNAWWLGDTSLLRFAATGRQRIRIQTREDGTDIDQIVLSAGPFLSAAPGALKNDATIVAKAGAGPSILRGPYVQNVTDTSGVVVWTTRQPGAGELRFRTPGGVTTSVPAQTRLFTSPETGLPYDFYQHEAHLFALSPGSKYTYDPYIGGVDATPGQDAVTTAPASGTGAVKFIIFGDSGIGSPEQQQVAARIAADTFDLALHSGDVAYGTSGTKGSGGNYAEYEQWVFGVYRSWMRSRPFFPSIGNHDDEVDVGRPYRDVFVLPENGGQGAFPDNAERYYSFDYGPIHFVALDTEHAFIDPARRQAQLAWLDSDLASTTQPWTIVYFHKPAYNSGTRHGSDLAVRQAFAPLLEKHRVPLAFSGHEHTYERSIPWREFVGNGGAVTYVVTGGGGAPLYPAGSAAWTALSASVHHYVRVAVDACTLRLEAVRVDGAVFDQHSLDRCTTPPPPTGSTPFNGSPAVLPGIIQLENFDEGGAGVAYADNTPGNTGGAYRPGEDVDIAGADDVDGGQTLGWVGNGEWLKYTVHVGTPGTYDLEVRVASSGTGGTFHVEIDGDDKTGPLTVPDTGSWQTWVTIKKTGVSLSAGSQVWRVVMDTRGPGGAVGNFNWMRVVSASAPAPSSTPYGGTPAVLPGIIQSEHFDEGPAGVAYHDQTPGNTGGELRATDVDIAAAADIGNGYTLGWVGAGEWQQYTVNVATAGTYELQFRVASFGAGGTFHVEIGTENITGAIAVPDTGGWQNWTTVRKTVALAAGRQTWRIFMDTNGVSGAVGNFNFIRVQ